MSSASIANFDNTFKLPLYEYVYKEGFFIQFLYITGFILQILLCFTGNCLALFILPRIRQPLEYIMFAFYALAISDLFQVFLNIPLNYIQTQYYDWFWGNFLCQFSIYITYINRVIGIWIIVYIAFDRYINICHKNSFSFLKSKISSLIPLFTISFSQFLIFFYTLFTLSLQKEEYCNCLKCKFIRPDFELALNAIAVDLTYAYLLPAALMVFFFISIFNYLFIHFRFTLKTFFTINNTPYAPTTTTIETNEGEAPTVDDQEKFLLIKVLLYLILFFLFFNFPYFIFVLLKVINFNENKPAEYGSSSFEGFAIFMKTVNSCLNPWIFYFFTPRYKIEFINLFVDVKEYATKKARASIRFSAFENRQQGLKSFIGHFSPKKQKFDIPFQ